LRQIDALSVPNKDVERRSIDNVCISNVDLIVPTTCNMQRYPSISRTTGCKKSLFPGISAYMDHEEHVVVSLMKKRKSFFIKESAARATRAGCQLVKNPDRYPYVLDSMQQVFISTQYLPRNSLPIWRN